MLRKKVAPFAIALLAFTSVTAASCSSDTKDKTDDAIESAKDDAGKTVEDAKDGAAKKADEAQARASAEELRSRIKANDTANAEGARSVAAIEESAEDLMGGAKVTGVEDGDGDGLDDDGKVQVDVDESSACLTLPETGENTEVKGGAC